MGLPPSVILSFHFSLYNSIRSLYTEKSATQVLDVGGEIVQIQYSPDGQVILAQERGDESKHDCIAIYNASNGVEQGRTGGSSIGLGNSVRPFPPPLYKI